MREILFRGKRVDNGQWVYGFYYKDGLPFIREKAGDLAPVSYQVVEDTVGQYTGLQDKYHNKIFEGDIVRHYYLYEKEPEYGKVYFSEDYFSFLRTVRNTSDITHLTKGNEYKIIGNIYDTPKLCLD